MIVDEVPCMSAPEDKVGQSDLMENQDPSQSQLLPVENTEFPLVLKSYL